MYIYSNMSCLSLAQIPKILLSTFYEIAFVSWISLLHFELTSVNIKIIWQRQVLLIPHVVQKHLKFNFIVYKFLKKRGYFTKEGRKDQNTSGGWGAEAASRRDRVLKTTVKMSLEQRNIKIFSKLYA